MRNRVDKLLFDQQSHENHLTLIKSQDDLIRKKTQFLNQFIVFIKQRKLDIDLSDTQLHDNLKENYTDFAYPTQINVDFLKSLGYDSVYYSYEGGQRVNSWFIFQLVSNFNASSCEIFNP